MRLKLKVFTFVLGWLVPFTLYSQTRDEVEAVIDAHYPNQSWNGVVGVVDTAGSVIYTFGKTSSGTIITQYTPFSIGSLTKSFIGLTALELIDDGKLSPDDTIGKWFPYFSEPLKKVTIRQIANHTGAIHDYYSIINANQVIDNGLVVEAISKLDTTLYQPGHHWAYSNTHYILLAQIICAELDISPEELFQEIYVEKYNMTNAFGTADNVSYMLGLDPTGKRLPHMSKTIGDAGLVVSGNDLIGFGEQLCIDPQIRANIARAKELGHVYESDTNWMYSLGWFYSEDEFGKFVSHSSKNDGFQCYHQLRYETGTYWYILTYRYSKEMTAMRKDLVRLLLRE